MIDLQSSGVSSKFSLSRVGVTGLKYPAMFRDGSQGATHSLVADWRLSVTLPADQRGSHMSRFVGELHSKRTAAFDLNGLYEFTAGLRPTLETTGAEVEAKFSWFRTVAAPVSRQESLLEYECSWLAKAAALPSDSCVALTVRVPVKSLCPCSKAISDRGAHNQRSYITVRAEGSPEDAQRLSMELLISTVEQAASSPVYPLLKRADEKFVTEYAYDHPVFVEDTTRRVGELLLSMTAHHRIEIQVLNLESIHAHDCFAELILPKQS